MKIWKRNAVVAAIVLFVCVAVYLNWSYQQGETSDVGKTLGEAALVGAQTSDPLVDGQQQESQAPAVEPAATPSATGQDGQPSSNGYFDSAKLNRQQARDSALSILQEAANDENADQAMREESSKAIQTLAEYTVSEAQIENLITAKGYADCVAFIADDSISVVVAQTEGGLTDADVAKITEIVTGETGYTASQIKIIEAQQ